jgi:bacteriorhodopsin
MYGYAAGYITFIWLLYPICWGLSEGSNVISVDHEMVFYSILDLFAGPVFIVAFLSAVETVEYDTLGLQSGKASDYVNVPRPSEKAPETRAPPEETGAA